MSHRHDSQGHSQGAANLLAIPCRRPVLETCPLGQGLVKVPRGSPVTVRLRLTAELQPQLRVCDQAPPQSDTSTGTPENGKAGLGSTPLARRASTIPGS